MSVYYSNPVREPGPAAILGDMHWGARNDSPVFLAHFVRFVDEVLLPTLISRGVERLIQVGDLMDRRKYVNFHTLDTVVERFFGPLAAAGIHTTVLLGNHDVFYKNTLRVNSTKLLFGRLPGVQVVDEPTLMPLGIQGSKNALLIPWLCEENREACMEAVERTTAPYLFGHLELSGFDMYRGVPCVHGDPMEPFAGFDRVYTGHFHTMSRRSNIQYIGTPYDIIWSDHGDRKGFLLLDPITGEEEWVYNPYSVHRKVVYDDTSTDYDEMPVTEFAGLYVKVVVDKVNKDAMLQRFVRRISEEGKPAHLGVVDRVNDLDLLPEDEEAELASEKDPLTALTDEIDHRYEDDERRRAALRRRSHETYQRVLQVEV